MISSPIDFFFLALHIMNTKPNAISGIARTAMSALKPRSEISHAVKVVPILAPIITPID